MLSDMLEYLEQTAKRVPNRIAFYDEQEELTFLKLKELSRRIGTALASSAAPGRPIALLLDARSIRNIPAIYGVMYAGCAYAPLDISMPSERLTQILELLEPGAILVDEKGSKALDRIQASEKDGKVNPIDGQGRIAILTDGKESKENLAEMEEPDRSTLQSTEEVSKALQVGEPDRSTLQSAEEVSKALQVGEPGRSTLQLAEEVSKALQVGEPGRSALQSTEEVSKALQVGEQGRNALQAEEKISKVLQNNKKERKVFWTSEEGNKELKISVISYEDAVNSACDPELLEKIRKHRSVYDPMSILYTSGSTGIPKGSIQTQFSYLHWTEATIAAYGFDETVVFGNQSPFFYANSILDIFPPVALGATVYLLPAGILNFPKKFIECLNRHRITELTMTPSSFISIVNAGVLEAGSLPWLRYGIMSGESMPWQPLAVWMEATPKAAWWHFYGSTEMFSVAVGKVEGEPPAGARLPVGKPFSLAHILFVDEDGNEVPEGTPGELLLSSPWVSAGYHRDAVRTEASWVVDPLNRGWHERFYRSGDMGYLREDGQLVVLGRKDNQIKHMGYRMELGEVEAALRTVDGWQDGCVLFQQEEGKIWCFFTGTISEKDLKRELKTRLARYMMPDVFVHLKEMPHTASMKVNRAALKDMMM